ncbi:MAG: MFS transporter [Actinomycetota bacterium]|nr:MFS transporter [Actinomycetota bacterium]
MTTVDPTSQPATSGTLFAFGLAMLATSQFGGVVSDRFSKRLVIIWANVLLIASSLFIGTALQSDGLEYWMLVAASAMQGVAFSFMGPARAAFSAELVEKRHLPNAIALSQLSLNATKDIGPAVAGFGSGPCSPSPA